MAHATGAQLLAKAIALNEASQPEFKELMNRVVRNIQRLAQGFLSRGYELVTGGTQTHLMVVDLRSKGITGKVGEGRLLAGGLLSNKQLIPFDPERPTVCSGIRIGSPCASSRGMDVPEMDLIVGWADRLLSGEDPLPIRAEVVELCAAFPVQ
jgi:glycine hydroxymethyltransferase